MQRQQLVRFSLVILAALLGWLTAVSFARGETTGGINQLLEQEAGGEFAGWQSFHGVQHVKTGAVWSLTDDGVLHCTGKPLGYLATRSEFTNFVLTLEWRWPQGEKPGKGGVLLRMTGPDRIWPKSLEAQINAGGAGDFWGLAGYHLEGPSDRTKTVEHPDFGTLVHVARLADAECPAGQWNRYEIRAEGESVTLTINGRLVNRATDCEVLPGKILLTAEGNPIDFRNVSIQPLD